MMSSGWEPRSRQVAELVWTTVEEDEKVMKGVKQVGEV